MSTISFLRAIVSCVTFPFTGNKTYISIGQNINTKMIPSKVIKSLKKNPLHFTKGNGSPKTQALLQFSVNLVTKLCISPRYLAFVLDLTKLWVLL